MQDEDVREYILKVMECSTRALHMPLPYLYLVALLTAGLHMVCDPCHLLVRTRLDLKKWVTIAVPTPPSHPTPSISGLMR